MKTIFCCFCSNRLNRPRATTPGSLGSSAGSASLMSLANGSLSSSLGNSTASLFADTLPGFDNPRDALNHGLQQLDSMEWYVLFHFSNFPATKLTPRSMTFVLFVTQGSDYASTSDNSSTCSTSSSHTTRTAAHLLRVSCTPSEEFKISSCTGSLSGG